MEQLELLDDDFDVLLDEIQLSFWTNWDNFRARDFAALDTVGDLFDAAIRRKRGSASSRCLSSLAFYRLRRALIDVSGLDRKSVVPAMPLRRLLPPKLRRAWWEAIETDLRLRVPRMHLSRLALAAYCAIIGFALLVFILVVGGFAFWGRGIIEWGVPVLVWFLWKAASHLPREIPTETLGDLVRVVVGLNQAKLAQEAGGSTRNEAWTAFRDLLSWQTDFPAVYITRQVRLVRTPASWL